MTAERADPYEAHQRYFEWFRRAHFPDDGFLPLAQAAELWDDQPDHPARGWLSGHGESVYRLTWNLLHDVLHAAGGVEYAAHRLIAELDEAERQVADHRRVNPGAFEGDHPHHWAIAWALPWDYPTLLVWLRTVAERIDRRGPPPSGQPRLGLLPPIADPVLRADVTGLLAAFKVRVGDERNLANYALHAAQIPQGTPSGLVNPDGTLTVAIPDASSEPIYIADQFTYDEGRDLRTFAVGALSATESLIEGLLDAFQAANGRVRARRGSSGASPDG